MNQPEDNPGPALPDRFTAVLSRNDTWVSPPPGLEDEVLAALRQVRSGVPGRTDVVPSRADVVDLVSRRTAARPGATQRPARRLLSFAAVAACAAVVGAGLVALVTREPDPDVEVALSATPLAPEASGVAAIRDTPSGFAVDLDIEGLPPAPAGTYYQAWLKNAAGELVTIGTFHARAGSQDILLWSGVDPADYPTLTVTLQTEGAGPASSGDVVLLGALG